MVSPESEPTETVWLIMLLCLPTDVNGESRTRGKCLFYKELDVSKSYKPGESAPVSGQYRIRGTTTERTVVRGEPLPPTKQPGQKYVIADKTKTK